MNNIYMSNICYYLGLFLIILIILSLFNIIKINKPKKKDNDVLVFPNRKIYNVGSYYRPSYYPYKTHN